MEFQNSFYEVFNVVKKKLSLIKFPVKRKTSSMIITSYLCRIISTIWKRAYVHFSIIHFNIPVVQRQTFSNQQCTSQLWDRKNYTACLVQDDRLGVICLQT